MQLLIHAMISKLALRIYVRKMSVVQKVLIHRCGVLMGLFYYYHWLTLIPAWISNRLSSKAFVVDVIAFPRLEKGPSHRSYRFAAFIEELTCCGLGAVSIRKTVLLGMVIPMLKIRRPTGRLIFNMGIPIPGKTVFYIETGPCSVPNQRRFKQNAD